MTAERSHCQPTCCTAFRARNVDQPLLDRSMEVISRRRNCHKAKCQERDWQLSIGRQAAKLRANPSHCYSQRHHHGSSQSIYCRCYGRRFGAGNTKRLKLLSGLMKHVCNQALDRCMYDSVCIAFQSNQVHSALLFLFVYGLSLVR